MSTEGLRVLASDRLDGIVMGSLREHRDLGRRSFNSLILTGGRVNVGMRSSFVTDRFGHVVMEKDGERVARAEEQNALLLWALYKVICKRHCRLATKQEKRIKKSVGVFQHDICEEREKQCVGRFGVCLWS